MHKPLQPHRNIQNPQLIIKIVYWYSFLNEDLVAC